MQRLSLQDAIFLHRETDTTQMHIGGVAVFEGPPPAQEQVLAAIGGKLPLVPHTFVTTGIADAVKRARDAAGAKDVSVMGAKPVQECLRAGLLEEIIIRLVPVVLGRGVRLLETLGADNVELDLVRVVDAPGVTHLAYRVVR